MPDRLDLDFDGERTEAVPPARRLPTAHSDDERFADPAVEEALDEAERVPSDEQEVPLEDDGGADEGWGAG
jgi:hypothetical protein